MPTNYHSYASVSDLRDFLSGTNYSSNWTADTGALRRILGSASRRIDNYVGGDLNSFGPVIQTLNYDIGMDSYLRNDPRNRLPRNTLRPSDMAVNIIPLPWICSISSVTSYKETDRSSSESLTEGYGADYFLEPGNTLGPKYMLKMNEDSSKGFYSGQQTLAIAGTWGWQNTTTTATTLNGAITDAAATTVTVASGAAVSEGNTILVGTEQMFVSSISSNNLTVVRGVHGTTAATHSDAAVVSIQTYPDAVTQACLEIAHYIYRDRDLGFDERINDPAKVDINFSLRAIDPFVAHSRTAGAVF